VPRPSVVTWLCLATTLAVAGCEPADSAAARRAWLRTTLIEDNHSYALREPDLLAQKFTLMASERYAYLRGSASQYLRDATTPGQPGYLPTRFASGPTADVLLLGDPHLENIGVFRQDDGTLLLDWNDFDGSTYGPFSLDVRRLALAVFIAGRSAEDAGKLSAAERDQAVAAVAEGYAEEIAQLTAGAPALAVRAASGNWLVDDLFARARRDGDQREELTEYTRVEAGARVVFHGEVAPPVGGVIADRVDPVSHDERQMMAELVQRWAGSLLTAPPPGALALKGVSRRLGAGVSSFANLRYYVLLEGPSSELDDDWLLEVKETRDPPDLSALPRRPERRYRSNGERVVMAARACMESPAADTLAGFAEVRPLSFRTRNRSKYQKDIEIARVIDDLRPGRATAADWLGLARLAGRMLGRCHGRADTLAGRRGADVIAPLLARDPVGFVNETRAFALSYGAVVEGDLELLRGLIQVHGALLGARR